MTAFHQIDTTDLLGGGWRAACTCGWDGERHQLVNDALSAAEARKDADQHRLRHTYRVVCPDCRRAVLAVPRPVLGGLRILRHTRSLADPYRPGQPCEGPRDLTADRVRFASDSS